MSDTLTLYVGSRLPQDVVTVLLVGIDAGSTHTRHDTFLLIHDKWYGKHRPYRTDNAPPQQILLKASVQSARATVRSYVEQTYEGTTDVIEAYRGFEFEQQPEVRETMMTMRLIGQIPVFSELQNSYSEKLRTLAVEMNTTQPLITGLLPRWEDPA